MSISRELLRTNFCNIFVLFSYLHDSFMPTKHKTQNTIKKLKLLTISQDSDQVAFLQSGISSPTTAGIYETLCPQHMLAPIDNVEHNVPYG